METWAKKVLLGEIYESEHIVRPVVDHEIPDLLSNYELVTQDRWTELTEKELNLVIVTYTSAEVDET